MSELITIVCDKPLKGFGKRERLAYVGIKFDDGQIAYQDEDKTIRQCETSKKLKEALTNAVIEVQ